MLAFTRTIMTKASVLRQLRVHAKADEIVKGYYWENGKGCAVGCTIHSNNHASYVPLFGIPEALARLEDTIFEGLPNGTAKAWPVRFMSAIQPGAGLSRVHWQFLHWLLTDRAVNPGIDHPLVRDAVKKCADLMYDMSRGKWSAESAAVESTESAAWAAWSTARAAARAAESAPAWSAAWSAESAAVESAESAARSTARAAAWSAESAVAESAESAAAASAAAYVLMADKLLALLKAAPVRGKKGVST